MPIDVRSEASLNVLELLTPGSVNGMVPVALFNRLDAAPADASHCGEYRIVYAKRNTGNGRFFLIFEAVLPNPTPSLGISACKPVAEFWGKLSDPLLFPTPASRAAALSDFYYNGLPGFEPVVTHSHYGVPFGQVRSNHFLNFVNWQLREWRTGFEPSLEPMFQTDTVKTTPLAEFFDSSFVPVPDHFQLPIPCFLRPNGADSKPTSWLMSSASWPPRSSMVWLRPRSISSTASGPLLPIVGTNSNRTRKTVPTFRARRPRPASSARSTPPHRPG